jgi:transcriptional regulator with XRE-family HTH domain
VDSSDLKAIFARRVRELAEERDWSVNHLADFAGLGRGFVSELLRGKKSPTLDTVEKVAAALEVEAWTLLKPGEGRNKAKARR